MGDQDAAARTVLDLARSGPARLGATRLICVDGPAGSGKTTLAARIEALAVDAGVVHTDDLLQGWDGLPSLPGTLAALLHPLAEGLPAAYRRYDWHAARPAELVPVPATRLLVVEGVGAGTLPAAGRASVLVWVEAPYDLRRQRGLERDGEAFAPHWEAWAAAEAELFAQHSTRERADLVVDAEGLLPG